MKEAFVHTSIKVGDGSPLDSRHNRFGSTAEAIASIPTEDRYLGLIITVAVDDLTTEYWWKDLLTDEGLILKSTGGSSVDISGKVDKVEGKSLILDSEIERLASVTNQDISGKVDKVEGKSLILDSEIERLASVTNQDISGKADVSYVNTQDAAVVAQILDAADTDYNNLKKIQDKLIAINILLNGDDVNLDQIKELADAIKADSANITALTSGKVNTTDIYNALDYMLAGKVLDARQGKVLNDLITALTTVVAGKEPTIAGSGSAADFWSGAKSFLNFATTLFASVLPVLSAGANTPIVAGISVKVALQNLQAQISALSSAGGASKPTQLFNEVLTTGGWSLVSGYYEYTYSNASITVKSIVDVVPLNASVPTVKAAEVLPRVSVAAGSAKFYATSAPAANITIDIVITESL